MKKSIKLNFIMNTILTISSIIFPLITFPYLSRILKPEGMGKISLALSIVSYFSMFAQLGIPTYGVRACAQVRDDKEKLSKTVQELFIITMCMCFITYIFFFATILTVPKLYAEKELYLIMSSSIFLSSIGVEWLYKSLEHYSYITIRSVLFKIIALVPMFLFVREEQDYVIYAAVAIFASSASYILNFVNMHKFVTMKPLGNYKFKVHLKAAMIFFAMTCAATVYTNIDTVMLGFMKTETDVGYYTAAVKVKSVLVSLVTSLGAVLLPRLSYYIEKKMYGDFKNIIQKALGFIFLISVPLLVYFIGFSEECIMILSGSEYEMSITPMRIIMPTILLIGITNITGMQMLVPLGKEKIVLLSVMSGAIVDVLINVILIPRFSSAGAAVGTLIAEVVVLLVQLTYLREQIISALCGIPYWKISVGTIVSFLACFWIKYLDINDILKIIISGLVFAGCYMTSLIILKEKIILEIIADLIKKIKR